MDGYVSVCMHDTNFECLLFLEIPFLFRLLHIVAMLTSIPVTVCSADEDELMAVFVHTPLILNQQQFIVLIKVMVWTGGCIQSHQKGQAIRSKLGLTQPCKSVTFCT